MNNTFSPQLNTAVNASLLAGKSVMRFYSRLDSLKITSKGFNDYVSEADQESELIITDALKKSYPKYKITAEESGSNDINSDYEWFIDPLDGTTNFIHGIPQFAISIGLCKNKVPILGVVYDPFKNELFCAEKGKGALLNNKRIRVSKRQDLSNCLIGTGAPFGKRIYHDYYQELKNISELSAGVRRLGAASLDLAYVASGKIDGFWEKDLNLWDVISGVLLIKEAGGRISETYGNTWNTKSRDILASNTSIHQKLIEKLTLL